MPYNTSEPHTPYHLTKSEERSQPYLYEGEARTRHGWRPHKIVVFVAAPMDAVRLRDSVPGMRVTRVAPLKIANHSPRTILYHEADAP
jgi:hypothetical protein